MFERGQGEYRHMLLIQKSKSYEGRKGGVGCELNDLWPCHLHRREISDSRMTK